MSKDRTGPHWEWLTSAPDWVQGEFAQELEHLEEENAALKKTAGGLALQLWEATPPNEISEENAKLKREVDATNAALEINDMLIGGVEYNLERTEIELAALKREKQEWRSIAEQAMNIVTSWQIDWDEMANNPEYELDFSKDTRILLDRMALLTAEE